MNELLYLFVSWAFRDLIWGGDLLGADNLPEAGPAVFVSNHLEALGPIAIGGVMPLRLHAWIHADMLDPRLAPDYLRKDFVEPQLHIPPPVSRIVAKVISSIHVPLLRALGGIPVYHTSEGFLETFRQSVDLLAQGKYLLVFPEDPNGPLEPLHHMRPFMKGFTRLGELLYERTRQILPFYPLAVHAESFTIRIGRPIRYNPLVHPASERMRLRNLLEQSVQELYRRTAPEEIVQLPLPNG